MTTDYLMENNPASHTKITFIIENKKPMGLIDLTSAFLDVGNQYRAFLKTQSFREEQKTDLYIKEIKSGSIIIDLMMVTSQLALPLIQEPNVLVAFSQYLQSAFDFFLGRKEQPPKILSVQDCKEFGNIIAPIANDGGSNIIMLTENIETKNVYSNCTFNSVEANAIQNGANKYKETVQEPNISNRRRVPLYWIQTRFGEGKHTADKAVIESITKEPVKVYFDNDLIKEEMTSNNPKFDKDWQELVYIVDVEVSTVMERTKVYKILRYYPDDTFDPNQP